MFIKYKIYHKTDEELKQKLINLNCNIKNGFIIFNQENESEILNVIKNFEYIKVLNEINAKIYTFKIKNIDCAHCALKIENNLKKKLNLLECKINLVEESLIIKSDTIIHDLKELNKIVKLVDSNVFIQTNDLISFKIKGNQKDIDCLMIYLNEFTYATYDGGVLQIHEDANDTKQYEKMIKDFIQNEKVAIRMKFDNCSILRIILGAILYVIFLILNDDSKGFYIFLMSFFILGYDIIKNAFRSIIKNCYIDEKFLMLMASIASIYIELYEEAFAIIMFYQIGVILQRFTLNKCKKITRKMNKKDKDLYEDLVNITSIDEEKGDLIIKKFARIYTPIIIALAILVFIIFPKTFMNFDDSVFTAVNLLVISCPCAIIISIPLINYILISHLSRLADEQRFDKQMIYFKRLCKNKKIMNIMMALIIKFAVMLISLFGYSNIYLSLFSDSGVTILAILNAMTIFLYKNKKINKVV